MILKRWHDRFSPAQYVIQINRPPPPINYASFDEMIHFLDWEGEEESDKFPFADRYKKMGKVTMTRLTRGVIPLQYVRLTMKSGGLILETLCLSYRRPTSIKWSQPIHGVSMITTQHLTRSERLFKLDLEGKQPNATQKGKFS